MENKNNNIDKKVFDKTVSKFCRGANYDFVYDGNSSGKQLQKPARPTEPQWLSSRVLLLLVGDQGRCVCELGPISFGCHTHPLLLRLLRGEVKGITLLRAAAPRCVNSNQELEEEEDEAGWVLRQKRSPVFFSFQLFIKAQCKGPDTRPAEPGCVMCVTHERVMRDLLRNGQLSSRRLQQLHLPGTAGGSLF